MLSGKMAENVNTVETKGCEGKKRVALLKPEVIYIHDIHSMKMYVRFYSDFVDTSGLSQWSTLFVRAFGSNKRPIENRTWASFLIKRIPAFLLWTRTDSPTLYVTPRGRICMSNVKFSSLDISGTIWIQNRRHFFNKDIACVEKRIIRFSYRFTAIVDANHPIWVFISVRIYVQFGWIGIESNSRMNQCSLDYSINLINYHKLLRVDIVWSPPRLGPPLGGLVVPAGEWGGNYTLNSVLWTACNRHRNLHTPARPY